MSLTDNFFVRFCTSGFGTGTAAGKAAGITLLIFVGCAVIGIIVLYWIVKQIIKLVNKNKAAKAARQSAAASQEDAPSPESEA